jgi:outer membrane protein assembly factor BamB
MNDLPASTLPDNKYTLPAWTSGGQNPNPPAVMLDSGRELWRCGNFHPRSGYDPMMHMSSSPVVAEGIILVPSGSQGNFQVLRPDGVGSITGDPKHYFWSDHISPMRPSALLVDSEVYVCQETGVLHCLDAKTGKLIGNLISSTRTDSSE